MIVTVLKPMQIEVKTIEVDTEVRYWEDTYVNGVEDIDFHSTKGIGKPMIPCAEQVMDEPDNCIYSNHWRWRPIIDIDKGQILNWKQGVEACIHYKVCDGFSCSLKDDEGYEIHNYEGYVPNFMCPKDNGYGDYIIMEVNQEGFISDWDISKVRYFFNMFSIKS